MTISPEEVDRIFETEKTFRTYAAALMKRVRERQLSPEEALAVVDTLQDIESKGQRRPEVLKMIDVMIRNLGGFSPTVTYEEEGTIELPEALVSMSERPSTIPSRGVIFLPGQRG